MDAEVVLPSASDELPIEFIGSIKLGEFDVIIRD
jgi:hypothetical protein